VKQIVKYKCDFCKRSYISKYKAREHESKCFFNPVVKSCVTCKHKDTKAIYDNTGLYIDAKGWCFKTEQEIFRKGHVIKDCAGWEREEDDDVLN